MPNESEYECNNWRDLKQKREAYRKQLIAKGVVNGSTKMMTLMCRKFK